MKKIVVLILFLSGIFWYLFSGQETDELSNIDLPENETSDRKLTSERKIDLEIQEDKIVESEYTELSDYKKIEKEFWKNVDSQMDEDTLEMNQIIDEETATDMMNNSDNIGMAMKDEKVDEKEESEQMNESEEPYFEEDREDDETFSS